MPSLAVFLFITLPWLNPFSPGPSPAVMPWLVTLGSLAFVLLGAARVRLADVAASAWLVAALISALLGLFQYFGASTVFGPWVNRVIRVRFQLNPPIVFSSFGFARIYNKSACSPRSSCAASY